LHAEPDSATELNPDLLATAKAAAKHSAFEWKTAEPCTILHVHPPGVLSSAMLW
jgi:hypothetical protein